MRTTNCGAPSMIALGVFRSGDQAAGIAGTEDAAVAGAVQEHFPMVADLRNSE